MYRIIYTTIDEDGVVKLHDILFYDKPDEEDAIANLYIVRKFRDVKLQMWDYSIAHV